MIIGYIVNLVLDIAVFVIELIPVIELPLNVSSYIAPVANVVGYIDTLVSIQVILLCISAIFIVDNWALIVKIAIKIWEMIPFV